MKSFTRHSEAVWPVAGLLVAALAFPSALPLSAEQPAASDKPSATTPAGAATTPAGAATTPAGAATTPAGAATTPVGTATTPVGTATTPVGTATTPVGTATTPVGTATVPAGVEPPAERRSLDEAGVPEPPVPNATGTQPPPAQETANDPTMPGPELRSLLQPRGPGAAAAPPPPPQVPVISMKGRVINSLGEGLVMLNVGGQFFRLKAGNEIRVLSGTTLTTIHIDEITEESVEVRITPQNESLSLR